MKEYNSIQLEDGEVQALMDIAQLIKKPINPVQFTGDISTTRKDSLFEEAFWVENNKVIGLYFCNSKLKKLPKSLGNLSHLRYLIVEDTKIQEIPSTLGDLHNLELIKFAYDPEVFPKVALDFPNIGNLKNLKKFNIDGIFTIYISPSFMELEKLEELKLEYCMFLTKYDDFHTYLTKKSEPDEYNKIPEDLHKLNSLKTLVLKYIQDLELTTSINSLMSLERLDLSFSLNIKNLDQGLRVKSLKELSLVGCELEIIPSTIGNLENLRLLNLSDNFLQDIPLELSKCKKLETIDLSWNEFEKELTVLNSLDNIRTIFYDEGNSEIIPKALFERKNLEFKEV